MGRHIKEDLTGKRFGRWTVEGQGNNTKAGNLCWRCRCDCGTIRDVPTSRLTAGLSKSCGCEWQDRADITGQRFGKLVVVSRGERIGNDRYWTCRCDCGGLRQAVASNLRGGRVVSCGCARKNHKPNVLLAKLAAIEAMLAEIMNKLKA